MNNLYDILEICLQELENGADIDTVISRYPDLAGELRPILTASIKARNMAALDPSPEVLRRGRAKLLQRASEMREAKFAPRKRVIPLFQRIAISFTLATLFLASGTGLVSASSSALPGENLYTVKITWENLRLFFAFDHATRELLEYTFEDERLHEINELMMEGRDQTIQFSGIYMEASGQSYVSGIHVMILNTTILPAEGLKPGMAVAVTGRTDAAGFVAAEKIELLPPGTVVPAGEPVKIDDGHGGDANTNGSLNENADDDENLNLNQNANENDNINVNENDNSNGNVNTNTNGNANDNNNDGGEEDDGNDGNANTNDNANENENTNTNDNTNDNTNQNENTNTNDNTNVNDNGNDNENENNNDNVNSNDNSNDNDNGDDDNNSNDNGSNDNENNDNGDRIIVNIGHLTILRYIDRTWMPILYGWVLSDVQPS